MPPACRWASPVGRRAAGSGARGWRRGGGEPLAQAGTSARLVLQRLLLEEAVETKWLVAAARACRAPGGRSAPLRAPARPGPPQGGSRGQVTPARAVGAGAHPRAEAAEPGLDGGAGRAAGQGLRPAPPPPAPGPARVAPGAGRWVGDAGCLPRLSPPPPPRVVGGERWVWAEPAAAECTFIASCLWQRPFLRAPPAPATCCNVYCASSFPFASCFFLSRSSGIECRTAVEP